MKIIIARVAIGQPYEGGDDIAEPTVSSIGQKVFHLPGAQKIKLIYNADTNTNKNKNINTNINTNINANINANMNINIDILRKAPTQRNILNGHCPDIV